MRVLIIDMKMTTVGIGHAPSTDGKYQAIGPNGEVWDHCFLRPLDWKRGKPHLRDLDTYELKPFKKSV